MGVCKDGMKSFPIFAIALADILTVNTRNL